MSRRRKEEQKREVIDTKKKQKILGKSKGLEEQKTIQKDK